jgi:ubiquinone biosynthesis UbiH/UbiF/VisC/COQ6 family hydroxylase
VIIGRGVIGTLAALTASKANLRVLLVGPKENLQTKKIFGSRYYALSPSSIEFIDKVGIENTMKLEHENISSMQIVHGRAKVILTAEEVKKSYLAKIASHAKLIDHLSISKEDERVQLLEKKPRGLNYTHTLDGERVIITFEDNQNTCQVSSKLIIGADGVSSWVRQTAGIFWGRKSYNQKAIVSEIVPEKDHKGVACQWFYDGGILALLPCHGGNLSLVWSVSSAFANRVLEQPSHTLLDHLNEISQGKFGVLRLVNKPTSVDLSMTFADRFYGRRIALLGDSAHTVHPLAGLGLNLGIYDLISLAQHGEWFKASRRQFFDPGNKKNLIDFNESRIQKIPRIQFSLDALVGLFGFSGSFPSSVRGFGMSYIDKSSLMKKNLIRQAQSVF